MTEAHDLPRLGADHTGTTRLFVDGVPFLIRGGEVSNSHGEPSVLAPYWRTFTDMHLNTLVTPVYWDLVEPAEGVFDWASVDGVIAAAREHDMRLVLLWFASWKNSMSCYAPAWVKTDTDRFPRCRDAQGRTMEMLSPLSTDNQQADARAFAAFMRHLRESDTDHRVVLVQVENEIGMIPDARDHSRAADAAYAAAVPAELLDHLATHKESLAPTLRSRWLAEGERSAGTWTEVFGESVWTEELFTAWHFGRYVEEVAAAGRSELNLPMYTNAALPRPGTVPGQYPSGGPLPHLIDIWRAAAPSLDFLSPDIYFPTFIEWTERYAQPGNPLFIPEALRSIDAGTNALHAYGTHAALGFAPYGIESIEEAAREMLTGAYDVVEQLTPAMLTAPREDVVGLIRPTQDQRSPHRVDLGTITLEATYEHTAAPALADGVINESGDVASQHRLPAGAIVIALGPDELILGGIGVTVTFHTADPVTIGILRCEEGRYVDGRWQHLRTLNGDQTHQGRHVRLPPGHFSIQRVSLYRYA